MKILSVKFLRFRLDEESKRRLWMDGTPSLGRLMLRGPDSIAALPATRWRGPRATQPRIFIDLHVLIRQRLTQQCARARPHGGHLHKLYQPFGSIPLHYYKIVQLIPVWNICPICLVQYFSILVFLVK